MPQGALALYRRHLATCAHSTKGNQWIRCQCPIWVQGSIGGEAVRRSMELWTGCVAGALGEREYATRLRAAGFTDVEVEPWRIYRAADARAFLAESGLDADAVAPQLEGRFASAFVRARKPLIA